MFTAEANRIYHFHVFQRQKHGKSMCPISHVEESAVLVFSLGYFEIKLIRI